jgi:threonine dehydrogenase-like Zn-dependent dehydrogenase
MRALWGKAPFQFDLREVPAPKPSMGEALVRITGCGICGTDLHFLRAMNRDWTPLGHEISGRVEEVGAGVSHLHPGDTVIVENNTGCGVCDACKNGESRYCRNIWTFMNDQAGIGDYVCIPEASLQAYRDLGMPDCQATRRTEGVSRRLAARHPAQSFPARSRP